MDGSMDRWMDTQQLCSYRTVHHSVSQFLCMHMYLCPLVRCNPRRITLDGGMIKAVRTKHYFKARMVLLFSSCSLVDHPCPPSIVTRNGRRRYRWWADASSVGTIRELLQCNRYRRELCGRQTAIEGMVHYLPHLPMGLHEGGYWSNPFALRSDSRVHPWCMQEQILLLWY